MHCIQEMKKDQDEIMVNFGRLEDSRIIMELEAQLVNSICQTYDSL